ncbi:hypothetical protein ASE04_09790 [Rhizobium sp. Root708]|uniref:hypothetical protein n=1 Tax=Rhizobium sp. Root708 TaxID=1736592 RepID=UPI0006F243A7|nr:hypothetical protein [Rhizobium sp. Root708]KRB51812.1 hypothetical protein ASE04_09790 [Rhizobium sp. Root708]
MREHEVAIDDALGAANSYLHAIKMAAETAFKGAGKDYCAFLLLADSAIEEITKAHGSFDDLIAEAVHNSVDNGEKRR